MCDEMSAIVRYSVSLFYLSSLYLACVGESLRKIPVIEANVTSDEATETQHTTCKIATEDVVADARATVTTVLTGACKAKTMDEKFANLEEKLIKEFTDIKWLLHNILEQQSDHLKNAQNADLYDGISNNQLSPRQDEIDKFNNTMQIISTSNDSTNVFIYYWRVKNFDEMLTNWQTGRSMRSMTFHVGRSGYAMYLRITPKYFPDGTIFVGVGLTRGRYDSILAWPFPHKIRLEFLDQSLEETHVDRHSRIWDPATLCTDNFWNMPMTDADNPECVGLSISRRTVLLKASSFTFQRYSRNTRYMWNGGVLIKLIIYL